jgi:hypothetical protein
MMSAFTNGGYKVTPYLVDAINGKKQSYKDQKIIDLLDRYETAAFQAQKAGFEVNGKNVARFCSPIVSPPAITDALKKNAAKIESTILQHPNQWPLIRKSLKPLREIDDYKKLKISNF